MAAAGGNNGLILNDNNNNNGTTYGVHTSTLTAERAPVYNDSNCPCAQVGTAFANGHTCGPVVPLCVRNLDHLERTMQAMNSNGGHYPISWASSGTEATAINIDEGCRGGTPAHTNGANNTYLEMAPANGHNEAQNQLLALHAQDMLRLPIAIQRMICERDLEYGSAYEDQGEYDYGDLVPVSFGTNEGGFIALGPPYILTHTDSMRVTRGYPSTSGESSVRSGPGGGSGSGSGSGYWNKNEQFFEHMGAQYVGYDDNAEGV